MTSILSTAARNRASDDNVAGYPYYSLHTGDPGTTGANEATGGSPAYARKQPTMGSSSGGTATSTGAVNFDVPAGTYSWLGRWSAATGGTFGGAVPIGPIVLAAQDVIVLQTATVTTPPSVTSTSGVVYHYRPGIALPTGSTFTRATPAKKRGTWDGVWADAASGVMRDDQYIRGQRVLLLEALRINSVTYGRDLTNAAWADSAAVAKDAIGIDGTANSACTITDSDTGNAVQLGRDGSGSFVTVPNDSNQITVTFWVRRDNVTSRFPLFRMRLSGGTVVDNQVQLNTNTGATSTVVGSATVRSTLHLLSGELWWELAVTFANNSTGNTLLNAVIAPAYASTLGGSALASLTGSIIVDSVMVELGRAFAGTPIFTTSAAVTQNADALSIAGFALTGGTLYLRYFDLSNPGSAPTDSVAAYTSGAAIVPAVDRAYTDIALLEGTQTAAQCRDILAIAA